MDTIEYLVSPDSLVDNSLWSRWKVHSVECSLCENCGKETQPAQEKKDLNSSVEVLSWANKQTNRNNNNNNNVDNREAGKLASGTPKEGGKKGWLVAVGEWGTDSHTLVTAC